MKPVVVIVLLALAAWTSPQAQATSATAPAAGARRVVSLVPATTEMLFDMGEGARLVGVGSYDRFPPEIDRLPRLGGLLDPNVERLLALKPDLVIVYDTQVDLRRQLERAGIPMFAYSLRGLADVADTMRSLGQRIGARASGNAAAERLESRLGEIRSRVASRPRTRTLLVFGREPGSLRGINASGGYGFLHDLLELAGGADVLADIKRPAVAMSSEQVIARAPEAIIEVHYGDSLKTMQIDRERRVWNALPSVPAVRAGRIHLLAGDEFVVPGPRVTLAAERFARALHPEAFR